MKVLTRTRVERKHPMIGEKHRCLVRVVINAVPMRVVMTVVILTVMAKPVIGNNKADTAHNGKKAATEQLPAKKEANADYEVPDSLVTWDQPGRRRSGSVPGAIPYLGYWIMIALGTAIIYTVIVCLLLLDITCLKKQHQSADPKDPEQAARKRLTVAELRVSVAGTIACLLSSMIILGVLVAGPVQDLTKVEKLTMVASGIGVLGIPLLLRNKAARRLAEYRQDARFDHKTTQMVQTAGKMTSPVEADKGRGIAVDAIAESLGHKAQGYQSLRNLIGRGRRQTPSS